MNNINKMLRRIDFRFFVIFFVFVSIELFISNEAYSQRLTQGTTYTFDKKGAPDPANGWWYREGERIVEKYTVSSNPGIKLSTAILKVIVTRGKENEDLVSTMVYSLFGVKDPNSNAYLKLEGNNENKKWVPYVGETRIEEEQKANQYFGLIPTSDRLLNKVYSILSKKIEMIYFSGKTAMCEAKIDKIEFRKEISSGELFPVVFANGEYYLTRDFISQDPKQTRMIICGQQASPECLGGFFLNIDDNKITITPKNSAKDGSWLSDQKLPIILQLNQFRSDININIHDEKGGLLKGIGQMEFILFGEDLLPNDNFGEGMQIIKDGRRIENSMILSRGLEGRPKNSFRLFKKR